MSQSSLSVGRYTTSGVYHANARDLFTHRNETLNPDVTLPKLLADFKRLFEQTQDSTNCLHDTILICQLSNGSEPVYVQRQLLIARSAYFEHLFTEMHPSDDYVLEEDKDGRVTIKFTDEFYLGLDITLLRELVSYMYWGYWEPRHIERTKQLFELAARFDLKELRDNAGDELAKNLNIRNAAEFLISAEEHDGRNLKKNCIQFIIQNKKQIDAGYLEERLLHFDDGAKLIAEIYQEEVYSSKNK